MKNNPIYIRSPNKSYPTVGIVTYLHTDGALYAIKSVPSWFLAVFDSKIEKFAKIWKKKKSCQYFDISFSWLQSNIMK